MMRRMIFGILLLVWLLLSVSSASAHANLQRSNPAANAVLTQPPAEIRLWFTEPLEPEFSTIILLDAQGNRLSIPPALVAPDDPTQLVLNPGELPEGLYTVLWRVVSSLDGHPTAGSFPITIGTGAGGQASAAQSSESVPVESAVVRWANLLSMALAVGSIGFLLFVWQSAVPDGDSAIERRLARLAWAGWLLLSLTGGLLLLLQVSIAADVPLLNALGHPSTGRVVTATRYGQVWVARMALWLGMGLSLWFARGDRWFYWVALVLGGGILLTNSLFSHANAAQDNVAAVASDWLHLLATALWVGGLVSLVSIIRPVRERAQRAAPLQDDMPLQATATASVSLLSTLVGHFSNYARIAVASLLVTGLYSAWVQVGSLEALLTTLYGQTLLIKTLLVLPLLAIAGVNLVYTRRGLRAGQALWAGRLRQLVTAEIALTVGILGAVGVMTAIAPARNTLAVRTAVPQPAQASPYFDSYIVEEMHIDLEITPGWAGENTFSITLYDHEGNAIEDASLIRLRFESQDGTLSEGQSELRPEHQGGGVYVASGANLSAPGAWRIRTTVQRPDRYDAVMDFAPQVSLQPAPTAPVINVEAPLLHRVVALLVAGIACVGLVGFLLGRSSPRRAGLPAAALALVGVVLLGNGAQGVRAYAARASLPVYKPEEDAPVRMAFDRQTPFPYLVTANGNLLQPDSTGAWQLMAVDARVSDVYFDISNILWAATDTGLKAYLNGEWRSVDSAAAGRLGSSHGFLFAMGNGEITRLPVGPELANVLKLDVPLAEQPASDFVMLGNHSHVIRNGDEVFATPDLGLSWQSLDAPEPVQTIWTAPDGNLLAATASGVLTWDFADERWHEAFPLPEGQRIEALRVFNQTLYAVAGGQLYRQAGSDWEAVAVPGSEGAYMAAVEFQYPDKFWLLDSAEARLWYTEDGLTWTEVALRISGLS